MRYAAVLGPPQPAAGVSVSLLTAAAAVAIASTAHCSVTMMYDDIAHDPENPYPGHVFNSPGTRVAREGGKAGRREGARG